jgi:putative SOS response-associated peptidase YedK
MPQTCATDIAAQKNEAHLQLRKAAIAIANLFTRYNIAPQTRAPIVSLSDDKLTSREMRWGMRGFHGQLVTNAKSETARSKPLFRNAWAQRQCVIPADGFYEWKTEGRAKLPYRFVLNDESLFWFAGLWNEEVPSSKQSNFAKQTDTAAEERFVILTRDANADVRRIHNRMPLILSPDEIETWLSVETPRNWVPNGVAEGELRNYRVGSAVSTPGLETPECVTPLVGVPEQSELW